MECATSRVAHILADFGPGLDREFLFFGSSKKWIFFKKMPLFSAKISDDFSENSPISGGFFGDLFLKRRECGAPFEPPPIIHRKS